MSEDKVATPRLLYKGPADETAETCTAADQADLAAKLKAGWRLTRVKDASKADKADAAANDPDATDAQKADAQKAAEKKAAEKKR